jgi:hypothetical protein
MSGAPASPKAPGGPVIFTATSTGCTTPEYKFFLQSPGGSWTAQTGFGADTWSWNTTGLPAGVYGVGVWVRETGSTASYDAYWLGTYTLSVTTCTSADIMTAASPVQAGSTVDSSATATRCPGAEFRFWLLPPGGSWTVKQAYSASTTWNWNTTGYALGTYQVGVWAKAGGSGAAYDAYFIGTYRLDVGTCTAATISATPASPQTPGTPITLTATAGDCASPTYEFWELPPPGVTWHITRAYAGGNTFPWSTTGKKGPYRLGVWVRQSGSTVAYDSYAILTFWVGT